MFILIARFIMFKFSTTNLNKNAYLTGEKILPKQKTVIWWLTGSSRFCFISISLFLYTIFLSGPFKSNFKLHVPMAEPFFLAKGLR